ncbi:M48 family metallopeptidase [Lutibacter sp.]|uniref:M48 family metallopeptidase n=1 Tax=Lutibacter sp. TaxID=1925666 RepID=UPI00273291D9|nr:M48 family metallopeptidase [Lutibacter sp.]MDP3312655.1 M48 family metallopeptidase [Lutibacter sp.]
MTSTLLFYILIFILIANFLWDSFVNALNAKHFNDIIPSELNGIYNDEEYSKSQKYKLVNYKFSLITSLFSITITLLFFLFDGFAFVDEIAKNSTSNTILVTLIFFGIILFGSNLLSLPFSYYKTFVIEEQFGFNKTTLKTFIFDKLKGWIIMIVVGGGLLALITVFYEKTAHLFWLYAWALITIISLFITFFYSRFIVPIFNKQTVLEEGELKVAIESFAVKTGFKLNNVYVIDGSKRSTKANAYFSGFGSQKRITLYDTLIKDLETDEVVAVLAHEIGHYKEKHVIYNLVLSTISMGFTLFILSLLVGSSMLSEALGVASTSFHIGLIAFSILYSPISEITGLFMNSLSRKFEYEADNFAKNNFGAEPLITSLKKLSKNSLSNLTPHPFYVKMNYSHPTLFQRIKNLKK